MPMRVHDASRSIGNTGGNEKWGRPWSGDHTHAAASAAKRKSDE